MSNFQFLHPLKPLPEPARGADQLVHSDSRASCMRARFALEQAVHWLYGHDRDLRMPYDRNCSARPREWVCLIDISDVILNS